MQKVILKDQNFPISEDNNPYKINGNSIIAYLYAWIHNNHVMRIKIEEIYGITEYRYSMRVFYIFY